MEFVDIGILWSVCARRASWRAQRRASDSGLLHAEAKAFDYGGGQAAQLLLLHIVHGGTDAIKNFTHIHHIDEPLHCDPVL